MKLLFKLTSDGYLASTSAEVVDDDYVAKANETFVEPPATLLGKKCFDGQAWHGDDEADYFKSQPLPLTDDQSAISQLGVQVASLTMENQSLKQANQAMEQTVSTLGMQVAQLLAKEQGGN